MVRKYAVSFKKDKYISFHVEAESVEEAIEIANEIDEKFGRIIETPYHLHDVVDMDRKNY